MDITRITRRLLPPFKGEHLERARTSQPAPITPKVKPLVDLHLWWVFGYPTILGWTIGGRVNQNLNPRKVLHLNTISALGAKPEFPWDWVKALGF